MRSARSSRSWHPTRRAAARWLLALALAVPMAVRAQSPAAELPGFAELEAAGAVVGEIHIVIGNVFDNADPREAALPYRWANAVHVPTRPAVIQRALLFRSGDPLSVRRIEETERALRAQRYVYDVRIRPVAVRDGTVDIEVATRDTWTLYPEIGLSRSGGANSYAIGVTDYNLLGTGVAATLNRFSNVDRTGTEVAFADERAFGGLMALGASVSDNSDGGRWTARIVRPYWSLDERWAAGVTASGDDRIDPVYGAGEIVSQYRRQQDRLDAFVGTSSGVVDAWVRRWSVGVTATHDGYAVEPGLVPPPVLPVDETLVAPFVRYELIEDRWRRAQNLDQVARPEFVPLGLSLSLQLGRAMRALGSTRDGWVYDARVSRGFEPWPSHLVVASASMNGRLFDGRIDRQVTGARLAAYLPHDRRWLLYASLSADVLTHPGPLDSLTLGGDNGLRGYPLRWQAGTQRALLTLEERYYTDLFPLRLFRIGAAAFIDVGRAWGGAPAAGNADSGWLADVGFGLRIFSARTAVARVAHVDVAFPLGAGGDIRRVQLVVRSKTSF